MDLVFMVTTTRLYYPGVAGKSTIRTGLRRKK